MDIERHSRMRQIELGTAIADRAKVYLDACYWIKVRDAALGLPVDPAERKVLHFLRRGVANGSLICPISASMFAELMKQPYRPERRIATARLVDELSLGVAMVPPDVLTRTEIMFFLRQRRGDAELHSVPELIWTKVGYVFGNLYPVPAAMFSEEDKLKIQKLFFDHLWNQPLASMVETMGDVALPGDNFRSLAADTNEQCAIYADELKSFEGAYDNELRGGIEIAGDMVVECLAYLAEKEAGLTDEPTPEGRAEIVNMSRNLLYFAMKKPEHRAALRTIHIGAALHASMRWDKQRKFRANDYYDFEHARAALSYCDVFLTEGPLRDMVTRPQVRLDAMNGCKVISEPSEAAEFLRHFSRSDGSHESSGRDDEAAHRAVMV